MLADDRMAVFIDGPNLWYMQKTMDYRIDYDLLINYLESRYNPVQMEVFERENANPGVIKAWQRAGFKVTLASDVTKSMREAIESVSLGEVDTLLVISGDGCYIRAIQSCLERGLRIILISFSGSINCCYGSEPRIEIIPLETIVEEIGDSF